MYPKNLVKRQFIRFIVFCKYNSSIPISEELRSICMAKPETFDPNDSIKEYSKLKRDGHNYSIDSFNQLMKIINGNNIVDFSFYNLTVNNVQILRELIENFNDRDIEILPQIFRDNFLAMIDTFEIGGLKEDTDTMREMKNYLNVTNEIIQNRIITL